MPEEQMPHKHHRLFVFLDRDGVINVERGDFVRSIEEWEWAPHALEGIKKLTDAGFGIIVVTNQSCISRGIITEDELAAIHDYMLTTIHDSGGKIVRVYHCPHQESDGCSCRKPKPGMLLKAAKDYEIDLSQTFFIGDAPRDMEAAYSANIRGIFIENESGENNSHMEAIPCDFRAEHILEAADIVIRETFTK